MKKIITLILLLCSTPNFAITTDSLQKNQAQQIMPISHEIAISKLLTRISFLEARLATLSWVDYVRIPWICLSIAYYLTSFNTEISPLESLQTKYKAIYTLFPLILFEAIRLRDNRIIPQLYRQIEQLRFNNIRKIS